MQNRRKSVESLTRVYISSKASQINSVTEAKTVGNGEHHNKMESIDPPKDIYIHVLEQYLHQTKYICGVTLTPMVSTLASIIALIRRSFGWR